jgi:hypothetical protein
MARASASSRWDHTAAILCKLHNLHRSKKERPEPYKTFHPYLAEEAKAKRPRTTPAMLRDMRALFTRVVYDTPQPAVRDEE